MWLGEVEGLQVSLVGAQDKLAQLDTEAARRSTAVSLGMPTFGQIAAGANHAYLFSGELTPAIVPDDGETLLSAVTALRLHPADEPTEAPVLGRLGGEPDWLQGDETPDCPSCATRMTFTAELKEGYDFATSANFGGWGRGYLFNCQPCSEAAFLWQR
ncbi:hypothetical protein [Streptomyces cellulosae]|uniref:Uncharacterized protein n=1 Tax=Streptomyces cellulosae TaxID=1968 RepID=A0ABW7XVK9_STRCE